MPLMKFSCIFFLVLLFTTNAFSQSLPLRKINFDNDWKFAFGNANDPAKDFNYSVTTIFSKSGYAPGTPADAHFYDSAWRKLNLPQGWFYEGAGIYRHVWLNEYNNTHIATDGIFVFSDVKGNSATVNIQSTIQNQNFSSSGCAVSSYITDRNGNIMGKSSPQQLTLSS